jgi:hypothetical protein
MMPGAAGEILFLSTVGRIHFLDDLIIVEILGFETHEPIEVHGIGRHGSIEREEMDYGTIAPGHHVIVLERLV